MTGNLLVQNMHTTPTVAPPPQHSNHRCHNCSCPRTWSSALQMPSLVTAVLWLPMTMQEASSGKLTFDVLASVAVPVERPPHDAVVLCPQQWLDRVVVASPSRLRRALHCRHSHSCSAPTGAVLLEVRGRSAATTRFFTHPTASFACHLHSVSKSNAVSQVITTVGLTVKHPDVKVEQITKQVYAAMHVRPTHRQL